jgi:hypothetical protein
LHRFEVLYAQQSRTNLSESIDQAIAGSSDQEDAQLVRTVETPSARTEAVKQICPNRLHDVERIEFRPQRRGELPPNDQAQVRLVLEECVPGCFGIAATKPLQEGLQPFGDWHKPTPSRSGQ